MGGGHSGRGVMQLTQQPVSAAILAGIAFVLALWSDPALAEKRVALVIGNSNYQNVPKLPNPSADATAMAQMFKNAGFNVVDLQTDVSNLEYKRAIRRFEDAASDADMAVVFFAGHGLELRGTNYMIPIDAKLADERDAPDEAIPLDRIIEAVDGAKKLRLVIVDACRDNPFGVNMKRQVAARTVSRGLARVEPGGTDTLIAYAAKAGSTAEDGQGDHSPLTTALLDNLTVPGLDIRLAFGRVRDEVMKITGNRQEPFVYGSLGGGVTSLVPQATQPSEPALSDVKADYELVKEVGTRKAWEIFLSTYKTGFYADLAAAQLAKLNAAEQGAKVATLEPPAPPSPAAPTSDEARAWDKIKDSGDQRALQGFIKRYPNSPLVLNAQKRLETLQQIAKEQEEKARAEAERQKAAQLAAQQAAEEERRAKAAEAERQKAAQLAAEQAAEQERRAQAAEAERQKAAQLAAQQAAEKAAEEERHAKAAEAERLKAAQLAAQQAAQQAAEEERRAKAAEAERQKAAQLAAQQAADKAADEARRKKAAETEQQKAAQLAAQQAAQQAAEEARRAKAAEAERLKAVQAAAEKAAQQAAEEERRTKAAEAERQKAAQAAAEKAAQQAAEDERRAKAAEAERQKAAQLAAQQAAEEERRAKAAEAERQQAAQFAAQQAAQQAAEEERRAQAAAAEKAAEQAASGSNEVALLETPPSQQNKEAQPPAGESSTPELIQAAQIELSRLGCYAGEADGSLNTATQVGIGRYLSNQGRRDAPVAVTESLLSELRSQQSKICPLECAPGQKADGETCVADTKPSAPIKATKQEEEPPHKPKTGHAPSKQEARQSERRPPPHMQVHQEVSAAPRESHSGGGATIGVGF
jgi:Caspase domain